MSAINVIGTFRKGEDIVVALDAVSGDVGTVSSVTARMRRVTHFTNSEYNLEDTSIAMSVADRAASGDIPAGWTFTLLAASTAALELGLYAIDATLNVGSSVDITEQPGFIKLRDA